MAGVVTTTTINRTTVWGDRKVVFATLALDTGDYAAGGVAVTPAQFGLSTVIDDMFITQCIETSATPTAQLAMYLPSTKKIRVFQGATSADTPFNEKGAEAFGTGANFRVMVVGY